jgi:hypothetical protein
MNTRRIQRRSGTTLAAVLVGACLLGGCTRRAQADASPGHKAEVTPAIAQKAEEILKEHPDAALGSEYPFTLNGQRYVGRLEEHDNPSGEPGRPPGKHRGVTVYRAD